MKVGILTIQSNVNIGNRLQNYALQEVLKRMGVESESFKREEVGLETEIKRTVREIVRNDRKSKVHAFNRKINWSNSLVTKNKISSNISSSYDAVLIGSDQVWNPYFPFSSDSDYLPGVDVKKIAYAASFGVDLIKESELREHIAEMINGVDCISMREESGAKMIKELTGREVPVVLDPTMLMDAADWKKIEKKPQMSIPSRYVLKYMLGESNMYVEKVAEKMEAPVLDISSKALPIGPKEFLFLINHAQIICTDSFHASVFSLLFEKPFIIFDRVSDDADMSSRMDSFCEMFGVWERRVCHGDTDNKDMLNNTNDSATQVLNVKRKESLLYIRKALAI